MSLFTLLFLLGLLGVSVYALVEGGRSFGVVRQLLGRPTSRIADLQEGLAEVAGIVSAEEPVKASHGVACAVVAIEVVHEWTVGSGKKRSTKQVSKTRTDMAREISLDDGTGRCLLVTKDELLVVASQRRWSMSYSDFCSTYPADTALLGDPARGTVTRYERCIELGKRTLVSGLAVPDPEMAPGGYRQGASAHFLLGGDSERKLLIVAGGQTLGAFRAGLPGALIVTCGAALLGLAFWFLRMYAAAVWGW